MCMSRIFLFLFQKPKNTSAVHCLSKQTVSMQVRNKVCTVHRKLVSFAMTASAATVCLAKGRLGGSIFDQNAITNQHHSEKRTAGQTQASKIYQAA